MGLLRGTRRAILAARANYINKLLSYDPTAYWPMNELAGAVAYDLSGNGHDGAYTGVTLGEPGIGDGNPCPRFDGVNDILNVHSAGLATAFDGDEGTVMMWGKVINAAEWPAADTRPLDFREDAENRFYFSKESNQLLYRFEAGNTERDGVQATTTLNWFHMAMTWSIAASSVRFYFNGERFGATLGTNAWVGTLTVASIGAYPGPLLQWDGWLAHAALWAGTVLPAPAIRNLATV